MTSTDGWARIALDVVAEPEPLTGDDLVFTATAMGMPVATPSYRIEVRHDLTVIHAYGDVPCPAFTGSGGAAIYLSQALTLIASRRAFACPCMGMTA